MPCTFDLHIHTSRHSPDSSIHPADLVAAARRRGLSGIVITEHDWLWTDEELEELRSQAPELVILAGIEVSAREGHFLVHGVHDPFRLPRGMGLAVNCAVKLTAREVRSWRRTPSAGGSLSWKSWPS